MTDTSGTERRTAVEPPQLNAMGGRVLACVLVGWLIVYNILRLRGDTPAAAWKPALLVGGVLGLIGFAAGFVAVRRLAAAGRVVGRRPVAVTGVLDDTQRDALRITGPMLLAAACAALAAAAAEAVTFAGLSGDRPVGTVVFIVWNVAFALWVGDEALRVRRGQLDGLDTVFFGCMLTAVLAGVALSRDLLAPVQVALALVAGAAAMVTSLLLWRLSGGRGVPLGIAVALVATIGAIAVPLLG